MLGRSGRPQYDKTGHGIVITQHSELQSLGPESPWDPLDASRCLKNCLEVAILTPVYA